MGRRVPDFEQNVHEGPGMGRRVAAHLRRRRQSSAVEHKEETHGGQVIPVPVGT